MQYTYKKILLFLCYAHLMGGLRNHPLFAAHSKDDGQLLTSERQNQVTFHSGASLTDLDVGAMDNKLPSVDELFDEMHKTEEQNIKQKEKESNENNEWIASMLEWTVNEAGDTYNTRKKAIDDKYKEQKAALEKKHGAINQQIEEKSKKDYEDFLARKKKKKEQEKARLLAIENKRKEEALRAEQEKKELQRKIDALKNKGYKSQGANERRIRSISSNQEIDTSTKLFDCCAIL